MSPALIESLLEVQRRAQAAGHGGKAVVYADACQRLGLSLPTLMRRLAEVAVRPARKRRSDARTSSLVLGEAQQLSAVLMEGFRNNDKKIQTVPGALERLRSNYPGFACVLDAETGELVPLSASACSHALYLYVLHPKQLRQPAPVQRLASDHPNDVWQIDASISTLFYVPEEGGAQDMSPGVYYKNKPENFEKIKRQRLTRYVLTDHYSGSIFVHYVAGGESVVNMAEAFLAAIASRPNAAMHGVPFHLMMDPGSAGTSGAFGNLLRRLQVTPVVNRAGNPRAKGQVENAHNLVEVNFESGFKFTHVSSIAWINEKVQGWMRYYNSMRVHSRHGMTRWAKWREITAAQLRLVNAKLARDLLTKAPETPRVSSDLEVRFAKKIWSVRDVPGVNVGEKVAITYNPFDAAIAYLVQHDADGHEQLIAVPEAVNRGGGNFSAGAALINREFKSPPDTLAMTNRKLVERLATGAATLEEAAAARKAKALPFGGTLDPYKHHTNLPAVAHLPRRGTDLSLTVTTPAASVVEPRLMNHFEATRAMVERGVEMNPERVSRLRAWYPDGVPEAELDSLQHRITVRAGLRVVAGGAAE